MTDDLFVEVLLTKGKVAIVGPEDADLAQHRWCVDGKGYAVRTVDRDPTLGWRGGRRMEYLHRVVAARMGLNLGRNRFVDHIDARDRLNNMRQNLRLATKKQNGANRGANKNNKTGLKGVSRHGQGWQAYIRVDGKARHLGTFRTPEEAHRAYAAAAADVHGSFMCAR